ncbi:alpha-glucuronidase [Cryobacterium lactosi]|uniref:Alpha-glucuronidase n=1 Tax=Cryobacterium lactosi TaxID=1259202 RepID=A0A4R9BYT2_9MICO|nr:alpha-glucuronidase [Cryobacterium lactosi]TFD92666.1 alpha-glucuronidase [Cryobacterium lactosi]
MTTTDTRDTTREHPAWLPGESSRHLGGRRVYIDAHGPLVDTVRSEFTRAMAAHGGRFVDVITDAEIVVILVTEPMAPNPAHADVAAVREAAAAAEASPLTPEGYILARRDSVTAIVAATDHGALYGVLDLMRNGEPAPGVRREQPAHPIRMLDHWDNMTVHPVMGAVERGYAGDSIFFTDGEVRRDLDRVARYARLLAAVGINRVAINNVNVHRTEALLLTDKLPDVARVADVFRSWGIRLHLSVNFASPVLLGGLESADPLLPEVAEWWREATDRVYDAIPDFGGYVVKADSEGQPGPFSYGRSHAEGANPLAAALAPHDGIVHWRAFVYNHHQDWRDRSTDRAKAAFGHFVPLDGQFADNVVLQVKHGPIDFQTREPVSPVIGALTHTNVAVELQVTQEYTGQQKHVCYLGPAWSEILRFRFAGETDGARPVADLATGGFVAVSNVGTDHFLTGHPLAQANLYAFGRLSWEPLADPLRILDEWIGATFPDADDHARAVIHSILDSSWATYEKYTAPLGVGFMVSSRDHYGPDVDGYEYSRWGTYHFADRDGVGVDRTQATGTGFAGQYPSPWRERYESLAECPDDLLLFFHHVPYDHVLKSGSTVIQHIYDTHTEGVQDVLRSQAAWAGLSNRIDSATHERVTTLLVEQVRSAGDWRDQIQTYFFRKSGVADATGRPHY